jgi:hypothetical protein
LALKSKRASLVDIGFVAVFIIALAISAVFIVNITGKVKDGLGATGKINTTLLAKVDTVNSYADLTIVFILFSCMLATWISAFFVRTQPVYFFIFLVGLIIILFAMPTVANLYLEVTNATADLSATTAAYFPKTNFIINQYPLVILLYAVITAVIIYSGTTSQVGI